MRYRSLRGAAPLVDFRTALFDGLAPDGSLYCPEALPRFSDAFLASIADADLLDVAAETLASFVDPIPRGDLEGIVSHVFDFPIPLVRLDERIQLLELFHGPTMAFKDVGARFMARVLSYFLAQEQREIGILVATSGDTGSAVATGLHGLPYVTVYVLFPSGKISEIQELQMTTLGGNVRAIEVEGTFDDCQRLVKGALAMRHTRQGRTFTTANSINVGRLLPQIAYYVWAYAEWRRAPSPAGANGPAVVVPSGNFGNVTAAAYARQMGIPVRRLMAATNANDVVPSYLRTGRVESRPSVETLSTAMDVGDPSNLGRLERLCDFDVERLRRNLDALSVSDDMTLATIRDTYERTRVVLDPHTAVGVSAARALPGTDSIIVAATAHPAKFPEVIRQAIGHEVDLPPALLDLRHRPKQSVKIPPRPEALEALLGD